MTPPNREAYFSRWFKSLMIAATLNKGFITEANDWQSCGVFIMPGGDVGNPWTVYQAGIFSVLWNAGWKGLKVCSSFLSLIYSTISSEFSFGFKVCFHRSKMLKS